MFVKISYALTHVIIAMFPHNCSVRRDPFYAENFSGAGVGDFVIF